MEETISFKVVLEGNPISKKRHRTFLKIGKPVTYDPQSAAKKAIAFQMWAQTHNYMQDRTKDRSEHLFPCEKPFSVVFRFFLPIPVSDSKKNKALKSWNITPHTKKPDFDNLEKFYLDCGTGVLWADDRYVVDVVSSKRYSMTPRVEIEVTIKKECVLDNQTMELISKIPLEKYREFLKDLQNVSKKSTVWVEHIDEGDTGSWIPPSFEDVSMFLKKYSQEIGFISSLEKKT